MNLSTARSERRAKEVGIRKTLSSMRKQLIGQYYMESILCSFLAFSLSLAFLIYCSLGLMRLLQKTSVLLGQACHFGHFRCLSWDLLQFYLAPILPFSYLISNPLWPLEVVPNLEKIPSPRKILVVFQFTISIALIIGTITVSNQIEMAKNLPTGYEPEGMLSISPASPEFIEKRHLIRNEILNTGMATAVGYANYPVTNDRGWNPGFTWEGMDPSFTNSFNTISISAGYAEAVGMEIHYGPKF